MDWKSFVYGVLTIMIVLLAMASFGFAHIGNNYTGNVATANTGDIPEKCQVPAGQDVESWKEHLGHHADTQECLQYFN